MRLEFFAMQSFEYQWPFFRISLPSPRVLVSSSESWEVMKIKQVREDLHHLTLWAGGNTLLQLLSIGKNLS